MVKLNNNLRNVFRNDAAIAAASFRSTYFLGGCGGKYDAQA